MFSCLYLWVAQVSSVWCKGADFLLNPMLSAAFYMNLDNVENLCLLTINKDAKYVVKAKLCKKIIVACTLSSFLYFFRFCKFDINNKSVMWNDLDTFFWIN